MSEIFSKILKDKNGKVLNVGSKYQQPEWGVEENGVLLSEVTVEIDADSGGGAIVTPFNHIPEDGKTYTVNYNGVAYECHSTFILMGYDQIYILGNGAPAELDVPASDAPFLLMVRTKESAEQTGIHAMLAPFDGSASCTISISGEIMHSIPGEYTGNDNVPYLVPVNSDADLNYTHDGNIEEIIKMINAGIQVYMVHGGYKYPVCGFTNQDDQNPKIVFGGCLLITPSGNYTMEYYQLNADGSVCKNKTT